MRGKNNRMRGAPAILYGVGDKIRVYTLEGLKEGVVNTVSSRGYWVHLEGNGDVETFIKIENVAEEVGRRGASQEEVEEMGKKKKEVRKKESERKPTVPQKKPTPLKAPYADKNGCQHDIVERRLKADGSFEPRGRCFDCGTMLDFTETGEKKITPP